MIARHKLFIPGCTTETRCLQTANGNRSRYIDENETWAPKQGVMNARDEFESEHSRTLSHLRAAEMSSNLHNTQPVSPGESPNALCVRGQMELEQRDAEKRTLAQKLILS